MIFFQMKKEDGEGPLQECVLLLQIMRLPVGEPEVGQRDADLDIPVPVVRNL